MQTLKVAVLGLKSNELRPGHISSFFFSRTFFKLLPCHIELFCELFLDLDDFTLKNDDQTLR